MDRIGIVTKYFLLSWDEYINKEVAFQKIIQNKQTPVFYTLQPFFRCTRVFSDKFNMAKEINPQNQISSY